MTVMIWKWLYAGVPMLAAVCAGACNLDPGATGELGVVAVPPAELEVTNVAYRISGDGVLPLEGNLPGRGDAQTIVGRIAGIPADRDLTLDLSATADGVECAGSAEFLVANNGRTDVAIVLQCRAHEGGTGEIDVNGTFNQCPTIRAIALAPPTVMVGETIAVVAVVADADGDPLALDWSAPTGSFSDPVALTTDYTCDTVGVSPITLRVDDGKGCEDTLTTRVTCSAGVCGDGVRSPDEECDDGNVETGDGCSADCRQEVSPACASCERAMCPDQVDACYNAEGVAADGPAAGTAKSELCVALLTCARLNNCDLWPELCYCGLEPRSECLSNGGTGPCVAEAEAAAETTDPALVIDRLIFAGFAAESASRLLRCNFIRCTDECF